MGNSDRSVAFYSGLIPFGSKAGIHHSIRLYQVIDAVEVFIAQIKIKDIEVAFQVLPAGSLGNGGYILLLN